MKMLCIDIDDCMCEFTDEYLKFLQGNGVNMRREDIVGSFTEMGLAGDLMKKFETSGALLKMRSVNGSRVALRKLQSKFVCVALTARPVLAETETRRWMKENFPKLSVVFSNDKVAYCKKTGAWLIDDQLRWLNGVDHGFAIAQPWNNGYQGARGDWYFITRHIMRMI